MAGDKELGERIKTARAEKGWKQKHLAAEVDVEPITVSRWERGATTPDLDVLRLVAEATGHPLAYFVESSDAAAAAAAGLPQRVDRLEQSLAQ
jgi:transcriptional regulator with XRE-family HTH domain